MSARENRPGSPEQEIARRTRRSFLTMGAASIAGYASWRWLRSREPVDNLAWPFRRVLQANESLARLWFSHERRAPEFDDKLAVEPRPNGILGLANDDELQSWKLIVNGLRASDALELTLDQIRALPKVAQVTELNCIEGWTAIVRWGGARFSDFAERYSPESKSAAYVQMHTPDEEYYVGLDMPSATHPQTLLCYEMNGAALTPEHGAPLRLVIPVKYGIKSIKRIGAIAFMNERPGDYWAENGYDWYAGL